MRVTGNSYSNEYSYRFPAQPTDEPTKARGLGGTHVQVGRSPYEPITTTRRSHLLEIWGCKLTELGSKEVS